jgi:hypothetical protein
MKLKKSRKRLIGNLLAYTTDEAIIWGPSTQVDHDDFEMTVEGALEPYCSGVNARVWGRNGKAENILISMVHPFWTKNLIFTFPAMSAVEIVRRVSDAITYAQTVPNLDPVEYARESLSHGSPGKKQKVRT